MSPPKIREGNVRGYIVPVGGAEQKQRDGRILERFVALCGGKNAMVAVLPTASRLRDTGERYVKLFEEIGVKSAVSLDFDERADAFDAGKLAELEQATGIFMTGGNQLRLSTILGGTDVARVIRRRNAEGVHVAGTSAGAGFISEHMIAFGQVGATPLAGMVTLAPGLGLTNRIVVDQHFRQRDRLGRLLAAVSYNPFVVGLGLDEDTAAFMAPDQVIEVVGSGAITVVDGAGLEYSSISFVRPGEPVCITGIKLHVLVEGAKFDLHARKAIPIADAKDSGDDA
ncbi:MAG: cyanophycinase [Myxococcales bacterium]|nr:cyanophycinase [Myxococcales bacterium]